MFNLIKSQLQCSSTGKSPESVSLEEVDIHKTTAFPCLNIKDRVFRKITGFMDSGTECSEFDLGWTFSSYVSYVISRTLPKYILNLKRLKYQHYSIIEFDGVYNIPNIRTGIYVLKLKCLSPCKCQNHYYSPST